MRVQVAALVQDADRRKDERKDEGKDKQQQDQRVVAPLALVPDDTALSATEGRIVALWKLIDNAKEARAAEHDKQVFERTGRGKFVTQQQMRGPGGGLRAWHHKKLDAVKEGEEGEEEERVADGGEG